jgi:hypothetical protein
VKLSDKLAALEEEENASARGQTPGAPRRPQPRPTGPAGASSGPSGAARARQNSAAS